MALFLLMESLCTMLEQRSNPKRDTVCMRVKQRDKCQPSCVHQKDSIDVSTITKTKPILTRDIFQCKEVIVLYSRKQHQKGCPVGNIFPQLWYTVFLPRVRSIVSRLPGSGIRPMRPQCGDYNVVRSYVHRQAANVPGTLWVILALGGQQPPIETQANVSIISRGWL